MIYIIYNEKDKSSKKNVIIRIKSYIGDNVR